MKQKVVLEHAVYAIPHNGTYQGNEGAVKFITSIISITNVLDFKIAKFVADQINVVVLGSDKQKVVVKCLNKNGCKSIP